MLAKGIRRVGICARCYSTGNKISFKKKGTGQFKPSKTSVQPHVPARTRFAPSPTGFLHLGSLRTALYNFLLAKSTNGTFILRLEDTDQKRLVEGAEQNIYDSLRWCGLSIDEGPEEGGQYGPYRQSSRKDIYAKYVDVLLESGHAYKCYCLKERLINLRESASKLKPPTTATYDRKCLHSSNSDSKMSGDYVVRFKSPDAYESFHDLLHGTLNLQPQYNSNDRRYDDFVIMKSDGLPTYHLANVVDDHLMRITHVIRGEEWLASTPKHIAIYRAFGWEPPKFAHIPLLTSLTDQKLSKRKGDIGVLSMKGKGILPEALINFCALFGWSPPRLTPGVSSSEALTLQEMIGKFSLDNLTKGNAKVNDLKLYFLNKTYLTRRIKDPVLFSDLVEDYYPKFREASGGKQKDDLRRLLEIIGPSLKTLNEITDKHAYLFQGVDHKSQKLDVPLLKASKDILSLWNSLPYNEPFESRLQIILETYPHASKKDVFQALRFALTGGVPGLTIPILVEFLDTDESQKRITQALKYV